MIRQAKERDTSVIHSLVCESIQQSYSPYYSQEILDFFFEHHNLANIREDILQGNIYVLEANGSCVGTGTYSDNCIRRVFIHPAFQNKGYGSILMDHLEAQILQKYPKVTLSSSITGHPFYINRGYYDVENAQIPLKDNLSLEYTVMEK